MVSLLTIPVIEDTNFTVLSPRGKIEELEAITWTIKILAAVLL